MNTATQSSDGCQRIGMIQALREAGYDPQVFIQIDEVVVDQIVQLLGRIVGSNARVKVIGTVGEAGDNHVWIRAWAVHTAGGGQGAKKDRSTLDQEAASLFSSARRVSASSGVMRSISALAKRWRSPSSGDGA